MEFIDSKRRCWFTEAYRRYNIICNLQLFSCIIIICQTSMLLTVNSITVSSA